MTGGELAFAVAALLFLLWQLLEVVLRGRIYDLLFDEDFLYFYDHPILFSLEAAGYALVGYYVIRFAFKRKSSPRKK